MSDHEAALFPIPNLVAFPGTVIPLHVFEPRYRQLVADCLEDKRMIGVCHTQKTIRDAPKNQSPAEALRTNQATYQPQEVFSAGYCKLLETTPDGRLLAEIQVSKRLVIKTEKQTLPYRIVNCDLLVDEPQTNPEQCDLLQRQIIEVLHPLVAKQSAEIADRVKSPEIDSVDISFEIFQFLRFDPDHMQAILESRSVFERLSMIWEIVNQS